MSFSNTRERTRFFLDTESSMKSAFKITIITPVFNGERYLDETIRSVLSQSYSNIEYIVVDGQSIDNTIKIIDTYRSSLSKVIVERDNSMYEAINRGLDAATGDYVLVLNSDDCLANSQVVSEVVEFINSDPGCLAYYGNIVKREDQRLTKRKVFQICYTHLLYTQHCTLIPHPALFVNRISSLSLVGHYDLSYQYASDFDYILRLLKNGVVKYMDIYTTIFRIHSDSITSSGKLNPDRIAILNHHADSRPKFVKSLYYYFIWSKYKLVNLLVNMR
jgi:glycosyltransferase involved in cell wall biosynthesis